MLSHPKSRRKSSSFRPHNGRYPMKIQKQVSIESLPVPILEYIFDFLQTPDLLQVCLSSKYLYLPAVNRLYKKLIITGDNTALDYAQFFLKNWNKNYGTAFPPRKLPVLIQVISQNAKLAQLIRHVVVTNTKHVADIPSLLRITRVTTFYCTQPLALAPSSLAFVQDLSVSVSRDVCAPHLRELRLCHSNTLLDSKKYEELADSLLRAGTLSRLRSLVLETAEEDRDLRRLNMMNQSRHEGDSCGASWPAFFRVLAKRGVKLQLSLFGFDGHFGDAAVQLTALLAQTIELDHLHTLEIRCKEVSHGHESHSAQATTILNELTQRTSSLRRLDVSPSDNCLTCQMVAVSNALRRNMPDQLEQLSLVMESPNQGAADEIRALVLQHQRSLRTLKLVDRSSLEEDRRQLHRKLSVQNLYSWEHGCFYQYRIQKAFFPCSSSMCSPDYNSAQFATDPMIECIRVCRNDLAAFLKQDPIYAHARDALPMLRHYTVVDYTIDLHENAVSYNGHTISLESG